MQEASPRKRQQKQLASKLPQLPWKQAAFVCPPPACKELESNRGGCLCTSVHLFLDIFPYQKQQKNFNTNNYAEDKLWDEDMKNGAQKKWTSRQACVGSVHTGAVSSVYLRALREKIWAADCRQSLAESWRDEVSLTEHYIYFHYTRTAPTSNTKGKTERDYLSLLSGEVAAGVNLVQLPLFGTFCVCTM